MWIQILTLIHENILINVVTQLQMDSLNLIPRHYLPYHQNGVEGKNEHSTCFNVHVWTNGVSLNKKLGFLIYDDGGNMVPWNLKCKLVSMLSWTLHNKGGKNFKF
jgi:hypothetical protein